jgi:hypothetical protein
MYFLFCPIQERTRLKDKMSAAIFFMVVILDK